MENADALESLLRDLFRSQRLAVLATQREGQPFANLVAFAATDDLKHLAFATTRATRKYANLSADSQVAMLVDNRRNQVSDFENAAAVTAIGKAEEVGGPNRDRLLEVYLAKHPHLKGFATSPTSALIKVTVEKYDVVRRFQHVVELRGKP
ncbi:MAG: pyridoxamine 5'-phosphate oxidase family protein [Desulfobacterales bacterium]|nr:MAG: pyridoxamine 5'-phosphate oxidase family protein [Desulfobacterales bacterium]UCG80036.1 MAG: pyridoxamine 5'-phosphate oxidase family protein [Desulfobacterales bacterium]